MGPQLQRFSTDVSRSLNRTRFTLAIKQLAKSASERACCWTGNDTTNLLASVRELNEVVTKTPRDELQTLMPTVFSPLSKAINWKSHSKDVLSTVRVEEIKPIPGETQGDLHWTVARVRRRIKR